MRTYQLPKRNSKGNLILRMAVHGMTIYIGKYSEEADYWAAHSKLKRLFGKGTRGLAFAKTLKNGAAKELVLFTMSINN